MNLITFALKNFTVTTTHAQNYLLKKKYKNKNRKRRLFKAIVKVD